MDEPDLLALDYSNPSHVHVDRLGRGRAQYHSQSLLCRQGHKSESCLFRYPYLQQECH